jgi:hypothetical protein
MASADPFAAAGPENSSMDQTPRTLRTVRVLLTVTALEFFGPVVRDFGPSHALNPTWVGHARVHLVWLLGFMVLSGLANLYLIWFRRPRSVRDLWLAALWQGANLGGFWTAYVLVPVYGGQMTVPDTHMQVLGVDENVFVFAVLSVLLGIALVLLGRARGTGGADGTP